jgi:hypothetical protein
MKPLYPVVLAILFFSVVSCSKSGGDTQKPVVVLNTPVGNQQFTAGQVVTISGTVSDNDEIHMVHVIVTDKTHDVQVKHLEVHADAASYEFNETFIAAAATTYLIHVEADDHVGNTTIIEIDVKGI